jgi:hypothetical protein
LYTAGDGEVVEDMQAFSTSFSSHSYTVVQGDPEFVVDVRRVKLITRVDQELVAVVQIFQIVDIPLVVVITPAGGGRGEVLGVDSLSNTNIDVKRTLG